MHGTQNDAIVVGMAQTKERPYGLVSIDVHLNILLRWVILDQKEKLMASLYLLLLTFNNFVLLCKSHYVNLLA